MDNFRHRTLNALGWVARLQVIRHVLQFVLSIVLARLLTPNDFGLLGMILVFSQFAAMFGDLGFGSSVIQKSEVSQKQLSSVFWVNIFSGVLLTLVFIATAPLIALFYSEPRLVPFTIAISFSFIIASFGIVHRSLLEKKLNFRKVVGAELWSLIISGLTAVGMAFGGFGTWCLVAQVLIRAFLLSLLLWRSSPWRPRFVFSFNALKGLSRFSLNLMGSRFFTYWFRKADDILIGRYFGSVVLGIYSRAYNIMLFPITQVSWLITRVMFPALSSIKDDLKRVKRVYLQVVRVIALLTFPLMTGLFVTADLFIPVVYGAQWNGAIPLVKLLCIAGIGQAIGTTSGWIYTSQGRTDILLKWGMVAGTVRVLSFVIGLRWGVQGALIAYISSGYILLWYPSWKIPGRLINMKVMEVVKSLTGPLACAVTMGGTVFLVRLFVSPLLPMWLALALEVAVGTGVYYLLVHGFRVKAYVEVKEVIRERLKKNGEESG